MAEQLGEAVLRISADTRQLQAGLDRARQQAEQNGQAIGQAFTNASQGPASSIRSIQSLQAKLQGLRASFETVQIGSKGFRDLQREIQNTERELQRASSAGADFGSSLLGSLGIGIGAGAGIGAFLKGSVQQAIELETIGRKLGNTLGPEGVGAALDFTRGLSNDLGLNFKILADSFSRFTAAATAANVPLQTQRELFAAVSKAGQSLGLSNEEINGSFLALQQVASKGTVAMEELRGQLGERLPIALSATAKGLGVTQQELIKLVESGKLTADQFFPALTKGLNELTASSGGVETTAQAFGKLQNAWEGLLASFGQNQLPAVTANIATLTEGLSSLAGAINQLNGLQIPGWLRQALANLGPSLVIGPAAITNGLRDVATRAPQRQAPAGPPLTKEIQNRLSSELQKQQQQAAQAAATDQRGLDLILQRAQAALQRNEALSKLDAARLAPGLNDLDLVKLQNELRLNEQILGLQAQRLQLDRELRRPKGIGDGKPNASGVATQNLKAIEDLQAKIRAGEIEIATIRIQNQQAEDAAFRRRREQQQTLALELEAFRKGPDAVISPTSLLRIRLANQDVRDAYASAGKALVDNARSAASALKGAQDSFNSTARGGFQFLTPGLQQEQLAAAQASVQRAVDAGLVRTGIDISTPERLFQVASFAEQIVPAQKRLEEAIIESAAATRELIAKDWNVYVNAGSGTQGNIPLAATGSPQRVVGVINGVPLRA